MANSLFDLDPPSCERSDRPSKISATRGGSSSFEGLSFAFASFACFVSSPDVGKLKFF
jgi:hypothetical protein